MKGNIILFEDDPNIRELIGYNLEKEGFSLKAYEDGRNALEKIMESKPDLVLLDIMLPVKSGLDICKEIRQNRELAEIPVIVLTARGDEIDKVIGLELGADDYITKPFSNREMIARIKALLRRTKNPEVLREDTKIIRGKLEINRANHEVYLNKERMELTLKEFKLLELLSQKPGRVFTRDYLLESIWDYEYSGDTRTVDVHIRHLRKKIGENYIETIRGIGYRFTENT